MTAEELTLAVVKTLLNMNPSKHRIRWVTTITIVVIALMATSGVFIFGRQADQGRRLEVLLGQITAQANRLSALEWQATAKKGADKTLLRSVEETNKELQRALAALARYEGESAALRAVTERYRVFATAMQEEFRLLAAGQIDEAHEVDEKSVDPAYDELSGAIATAREKFNQSANLTHRISLLGSATSVVLAMIAIGLLLVNVERSNAEVRVREIEQQALRRSEERFRALVQNAHDFVATLDGDGVLSYASASSSRVVGIDAPDLVGTSVYTLFDGGEQARMEALIQSCVGGGAELQRGELRLASSADAVRTAEVVLSNRLADPAIAGIVMTLRDISNSKLAEAALAKRSSDLEQSNNDLQQFAYVASHDLQEPLRMITSYLALLSQRYRGRLDAQADEFIGFAVDGAERMQRLIQDLLAYSRVGSKPKEFTPVDCNAVLASTVKMLQAAAQESAATITHDPLPTVIGDATQLGQLFQNLLGNGIKYRNSNALVIHVGVEREGSAWRFAVRDNGIGIDPKDAERVFVIFQRLHTREEYAGTGIGLAVCKKIVERHGGRIWLESELGKGSTFYFSIPAQRSEHNDANL